MDSLIQQHLDSYPENARKRLIELRDLILQLSSSLSLGEVEESLKWGELSFKVKTGSPVRIDWKLKFPDHYYLFFHCQTKLIDTFRELHGDVLDFQGNRAIVLNLTEPLPQPEISHCLKLALTYQQRKHLPLLGA